jgi:hypothetical protein
MPMALTSSSTERVDALDVGLLHDGGEGLLRHPARLQEPGEVAAPAQGMRSSTVPARVSQLRNLKFKSLENETEERPSKIRNEKDAAQESLVAPAPA